MAVSEASPRSVDPSGAARRVTELAHHSASARAEISKEVVNLRYAVDGKSH